MATQAIDTADNKKALQTVNNTGKSTDNGSSPQKPVKKGMTPGLSALIVFVLLLIVLFVAGVFLFFNLLGVKDAAVAFLQQGYSPYQEQIDNLAHKQIDLDEWELELAAKEAELIAKDAAAMVKENELLAREEKAKALDMELADLEETLSGKSATLADVVSRLEKMDEASAARIIEGMVNTESQTAILLSMQPNKASAVLKSMNATVASQLVTYMMQIRRDDTGIDQTQ